MKPKNMSVLNTLGRTCTLCLKKTRKL